MMYVIDLLVMISQHNDIVLSMLCYDIVIVTSSRRCRMSRSYDSGPTNLTLQQFKVIQGHRSWCQLGPESYDRDIRYRRGLHTTTIS